MSLGHGSRSREGERLGVLIEFLPTTTVAFPSHDESASTVHPAVPPILDGVVAASGQPSCNLGPALPHVEDIPFDLLAFLGSDWIMAQRRLQVLMISFATLLRSPGDDLVGDLHPVVGALVGNECEQAEVFVLRPRPSLEWGVHDLALDGQMPCTFCQWKHEPGGA